MNIEVNELLEKSYRKESPFYIFGAGARGRQCSELCLHVRLPIAFFFDNNEKLWGKNVVDNVKCCNYQENTVDKNGLCCVCVAKEAETVKNQLREAGFEKVIDYDELFDSDWIMRRFYNHDFIAGIPYNPTSSVESNKKSNDAKDKKIAIYTCVLGGYDNLYLPNFDFAEGTDYYIITDRMDMDAGNVNLLHVDEVIPAGLEGNTIKNRYCKMHGKEIFPEYDYSIYVDGNAYIKRDVSNYVNRISELGLSFHVHENRQCIYSEGIAVVLARKGDKYKIQQQLCGYAEEGMPRNFGLIAGGLIVRDHNNHIANKIMHEWYEEFMKGEKRDQLSFSYVVWKNELNMNKITTLNDGKSRFENADLEIVQHR